MAEDVLRQDSRQMEYFDTIKRHNYEQISIIQNQKTKLFAVDVIHDTTMGPAVGGTRFMKYPSEEEAICDLYPIIRNILKESREKKLAPAMVADRYAERQLKKEKTYVDFNWGYPK